MNKLRVGVVGFSSGEFDKEIAIDLIHQVFDVIKKSIYGDSIEIVSGLTNMGIPGLAYEAAVRHGFATTGIACSRAENYDCFPCDTTIIVGDDWGDESETFLENIDVLYKFGGGPQSLKEFNAFKHGKVAFNL